MGPEYSVPCTRRCNVTFVRLQPRFKSPCPRYNLPFWNHSPPSCFKPAARSAEEAKLVAASLVDANLKGYDSHGVMRVPYYVQAIKDGEVVPGGELTILDEGPSRIVADGNWGFGQVQAMRLIELLAAKAQGRRAGPGNDDALRAYRPAGRILREDGGARTWSRC